MEKKSLLSNFIPPNIFKKNNFFWRYGLFLESHSNIFKFFDFFKLFFLCIKICLKKNVKTIHCRGLHPALIGIFLKYFFNSKLIFDMRGWWADEKKDSGAWNSIIFKPIYFYNAVLLTTWCSGVKLCKHLPAYPSVLLKIRPTVLYLRRLRRVLVSTIVTNRPTLGRREERGRCN